MVGKEAPFHRTVELAANPEPLTVRLNAAPPACAVEGFRLLIAVGVPAVIVKDEPPLAVPFVLTVTVAVPCEPMRLVAINAVNWEGLTNVVGVGNPFHRTVELAAKPEPVTVRVNDGLPAGAVEGLRLLMVAPAAAVTVKTELLDALPPAFTATRKLPWEVIRLAGTSAVS